jgi:hypothetical protein
MRRTLFLMLIFFLGLNFQSTAQGDLLVTPRRVVFEGRDQKEELSLLKLGKDTATYSISFVQKKMKEDGSFETVEKPDSGQMFADPYLRIFPRTVRLAPGEPQVIMVQCRRTSGMLSGEYRSHLFFRSERNYNPLGMENPDRDSTMMHVQLVPIYGMSIPVIIRSGEVEVKSSLSDLKIETRMDTLRFLNLNINRTGNISIYGNLAVDYVPVTGKPFQIGVVNGVGVYTNISKRNISIKLNAAPGLNLTSGKLKVRYTSPEEEKYMVYSEAELEVKP